MKATKQEIEQLKTLINDVVETRARLEHYTYVKDSYANEVLKAKLKLDECLACITREEDF